MASYVVEKRDELYSILKNQKINVDGDTLNRHVTKVGALSGGGTGTISSPLNGANGGDTMFQFSSGSNNRIRWGTCAMAVTCQFATSTNGTALIPADDAVPSWNQIAKQIQEISLEFNTNSSPIYTSSNGTFLYEYTARLLANYDADKLNSMDEELFTPVFDENYQSVYARTLDADLSPLQKVRFGRWVSGSDKYSLPVDTAGTTGNTENGAGVLVKKVVKYMSFLNLFPRMPDAILDNVNSGKITIRWKPIADCGLEVTSGKTGYMYITKAELLMDNYILGPYHFGDNVKKADEYIPFITTTCTLENYNEGSDITITGQRNVQSIMMLKPSNGSVLYHATATSNGCSTGQFILFNPGKDGTANLKNADLISAGNVPITSVQVEYGNITYPNNAIDCYDTTNNVPEFSGLYQEYIRAMNLIAHQSIKPLPYNVFCSTMPFVYMSMFASDAPKWTQQGTNIVIKMRGGENTTSLPVVLFKLQICRVSVDRAISLLM